MWKAAYRQIGVYPVRYTGRADWTSNIQSLTLPQARHGPLISDLAAEQQPVTLISRVELRGHTETSTLKPYQHFFITFFFLSECINIIKAPQRLCLSASVHSRVSNERRYCGRNKKYEEGGECVIFRVWLTLQGITTTHTMKKNSPANFKSLICQIEGGGFQKIKLLLTNVRWPAASSTDTLLFPLPVFRGRVEASAGSAQAWIQPCCEKEGSREGGQKEAWEKHNRSFCVGNSVTSGPDNGSNTVLQEYQKTTEVEEPWLTCWNCLRCRAPVQTSPTANSEMPSQKRFPFLLANLWKGVAHFQFVLQHLLVCCWEKFDGCSCTHPASPKCTTGLKKALMPKCGAFNISLSANHLIMLFIALRRDFLNFFLRHSSTHV